MKAWAIETYGDNSVVRMMDLPKPQPREDEVLIQVKAASVNPLDFKIRSGQLKSVMSVRFPFILGQDCAGVVTAVGSRVSKFEVGDEVYTRPPQESMGTLAEFVAVKESALAKKPENISFEEAAGIPLVGLTSWQVLVNRAKIKKGQKVFIAAGSGGVGSFAIQLAKSFGAYVIANTSTKNVAFVKNLGADEVIDYKTQDFSQCVSDIDIFFDTMGDETQAKAFAVLKRGGVLASIVGPPTASFAREAGLGLPVQLGAGLLGLPTTLKAALRSVRYIYHVMHPDGEALERISQLIEEGSIRPVVDRVYKFENANDAVAHVESGRVRGKVIVSV